MIQVTDDDDEFLFWCRDAFRCAVFVDEAPELCRDDKRGREFHWLATQGRHWGHRCHFISQGQKGIAHQVRANCTDLYAFSLYPAEAAKLFQERGEAWTQKTATLPQGHFYYARPFAEPVLHRLWATPTARA